MRLKSCVCGYLNWFSLTIALHTSEFLFNKLLQTAKFNLLGGKKPNAVYFSLSSAFCEGNEWS